MLIFYPSLSKINKKGNITKNIAFFIWIVFAYLMLNRPFGLFSIASKRSTHAFIIK
jgi:hypothetical protein